MVHHCQMVWVRKQKIVTTPWFVGVADSVKGWGTAKEGGQLCCF